MLSPKALPFFLVIATVLCGCDGHAFSPPARTHSDMLITNQVRPVYAKGLLPPPKVTPDAANAPMPDPLISDSTKDPLAGSSSMGGDPLTIPDPVLNSGASGGASAVNKNRPIKYWYWLKGSIAHGTVDVKVNGTDIGRYSVHIDTEISNYLRLGSNQIMFTTQATVPDQPVTCDLTIVYSQQTEGALPVLEYNTTTEAPDQTFKLPQFTTRKSRHNKIGQPLAPIPTFDEASSSTTKTMTFVAE